MASLFRDSFDNYNSPGLKWTSGNSSAIDLTGTKSRTGIGALVIAGITAPTLALPVRTGFTIGVAYNPEGIADGGRPIQVNGSGGGSIYITINPDGSLTLSDGAGGLATSPGGLIQANVYAYLEMQFVGGGATVVTVRLNGVNVTNLVGISASVGGNINEFTMTGPTFGLSAAVDDVYVQDDTGPAPYNGFLGPIRIYPVMPSGDSSPLQWTPSVGGPHFSLINQIPQNGGTSYVQDGNPGDIDQYIFEPSGIPTPASILGVQVSLLAALDSAGARSVGVQIGGSTSAGVALDTSYHYVIQDYDTNPDTGLQWLLSDFPDTVIGPVVTA